MTITLQQLAVGCAHQRLARELHQLHKAAKSLPGMQAKNHHR
jgi:hypothetical protein